MKIVPLILCGGHGIRLTPLKQKQFQPLYPRNKSIREGASLLEEIIRKILGHKSFDKTMSSIYLSTHEDNYFDIDNLLCHLDDNHANNINVLFESHSYGTFASISSSIAHLVKNHSEDCIFILPADLYVLDFEYLLDTILSYQELNIQDKCNNLVLFGKVIEDFDPNFGYIFPSFQIVDHDKSNLSIYLSNNFVEKPNMITEFELYLCNMGIVLAPISYIKNLLEKHNVDLWNDTVKEACNCIGGQYHYIQNEIYEEYDNISFDTEVLSNLNSYFVIKYEDEWIDMGRWENLYALQDKEQNYTNSLVKLSNGRNNFIYSENVKVFAENIENLFLVFCNKQLYIGSLLNEDFLTKIRDIQNHYELTENNITKKKWGYFEVLLIDKGYQVKKLILLPNSSISMQKHLYRSEHWIVVSGHGIANINNQVSYIHKNTAIYIDVHQNHKLINNSSDTDLILIEVQIGIKTTETDIIRYDEPNTKCKNF